MEALVVLLSLCSLSLWFDWLNLSNQAYSQCSLTGLSDPKPSHSRCQKTQPRTGYFTCVKLNTWHECFPPELAPLPDIFIAPYGPSAAVKLKGPVGLTDLAPFRPPPSARPVEDSQSSLQMPPP